MRTRLLIFPAASALLGLAGCVNSARVEQAALPPEWQTAVPKPGAPAATLAGVYVDRGDQLDARHFARDGTVSRAKLSSFLYSEMVNGKPVPERRRPDRNATIELRAIDGTHLEVITRVAAEVIHRAALEVEFEKDTGTCVLRRGGFAAGGILLVAQNETMTLRLWRAADGRLYAHGTARTVGGVFLVVPFVSSGEVWCRWDPATPAALQRQAAEVEKLAADHARAVEENRQRVKVGAPAPDFSGADLLTDRPVSSGDYHGKVVLLHFWSTETKPRVFEALRAIYEKYHGRGLEIVGICENPASERDKAAGFLKVHGLAWPQLFDGKGPRGELFVAYAGALSLSPYGVIDRDGNVAAILWTSTGNRLETALEKALTPP